MSSLQNLTGRVRSTLAEQSTGRLSMGAGAVVLAISGVFGGWAPTPPPPPASIDAPIDGGRWQVTVSGARLVGELKPMSLSKKENYWLVVIATVEIKAEKTVRYLGSIVHLPDDDDEDGETESPAGVVLMRDGRKINQLNPGMPEKVAIFFEQPAGRPAPTEITAIIRAYEYRENTLTGGIEWMPNDEGETEVLIPVLDKREAAAP